ncbi:hypothetical protein CC1G_03141 [Coprinopsis cinerea okayama7|uniref:Uncharacterized protein n=1 Tax=Coprinopsis cinerea (strain Okayama-7 / 130 / ATCC MYA-4618 / FGSC 9003) TaxID=240176 RepID=A8PF32_COPC7|nr:hypothetical protein CC1G_03141 [Coprinopsis cinerea okayama7\|eukprot:XP_001840912.2 hypothetical protein CC1G_03141 [Coprinopsis cinerea okayama7\
MSRWFILVSLVLSIYFAVGISAQNHPTGSPALVRQRGYYADELAVRDITRYLDSYELRALRIYAERLVEARDNKVHYANAYSTKGNKKPASNYQREKRRQENKKAGANGLKL